MYETFNKLPTKRQDEILYAAAEVFAEYGYWRANINSICERANMSNGALYRYFKSKEKLYTYVFQHVVKTMQAAYALHEKSDCSIYELIRQMLNSVAASFQRHPAYFLLYADIWSTSMNDLADKITIEGETVIENAWINLAEKAIARGEIARSIPPKQAAYLIDSETLLFFFSLASTYHRKRFEVFLCDADGNLSVDTLINRIVDNLRTCLSPKADPE